MTNVVDKFIKYIKYDTKSDESSNTIPTTEGQRVLAKVIYDELREIGLQDVSLDNNGYIMATLPSNESKNVSTIGFIAHMDTSPDMSGTNIKPNFVENYDGGEILLNKEKNLSLSPKDFPELKNYIGQTLITTDGTTLLGADDKAGVAEIIAAVEFIVKNPEIKHGAIKIGFTPDEEVGAGADHFDVKKFGADYAYTLDGGTIGELECENFNAASAKITIKGRSVHPGSAKGKMINSMLIANEFVGMLPKDETPETTEGYEGFYHLVTMKGLTEETELGYIIRDFDKDNFGKRKEYIMGISKTLGEKYGKDVVSCVLKDQYFNMKEKIDPVKYVVDIAEKAMVEVGITPKIQPIRGGTDGAKLSFMGLPTPNIFAGGENFHGKYEYISTNSMEKAVEVILKIVELVSK